MDYRQHFSTLETPQSEKADPRQVENSAGGHAFTADDWQRLDRFLILGSEGGTYYVGERALTRENAEVVLRCFGADPERTIERIVEISEAGRAPKNDPAIFALAMCSLHAAALEAIPCVCRIGTHLFQYLHYVEGFRGWGRSLRKAVSRWYEEKDADALAYQAVKYQKRGGWSHRDALRLAHPTAPTKQHAAIYDWICGREASGVPRIMEGFSYAITEGADIPTVIREYGLTREMVPTEALGKAKTWEALLESLPYTAMLRNLGNMSKVGLLTPMSDVAHTISDRLADEANLRRARVHPLAVLIALKTYAQGHGFRGAGQWTPVDTVVDALDAAFYLSFGNVEATGKRTMLALDVSGSMSWGEIGGTPLTPREGSAAMAMVTARTEPQYMTLGFSHNLVDLGIRKSDSLNDAVRKVSGLPFGGTDCALPMLTAQSNNIPIDTFIIYTDSETWAGKIHPHQALAKYRKATGIDAKLVVVGMTSNGFTIADPSDAGMLDVVGFDTATPQVIAEFSKGGV